MVMQYEQKQVKIGKKAYPIIIMNCYPQGNLYEGVLYAITKNQQEKNKLLRYDPYYKGDAYCSRVIVIYDQNNKELVLKDTLLNVVKQKFSNRVYFSKIMDIIKSSNEDNLLDNLLCYL